MKIAFVFISMPVGGAEDFALTMGNNLPVGYECVFVCLRELGILGEEHGAKLVRASPSKRWNIFGVLRLARWFKEQKIDVVHSQTYHAHTYAISAARLAGCKAILHQQKTVEGMPWRKYLTLKIQARLADRVLALSEKMAEDLRKIFALPENKVTVVPNAVDPTIFYSAPEPGELRRSLQLPSGWLIGAVASLNDVKNHDATLAMAAALQQAGLAFHLVFIGEGEKRTHLTQKISDLGLGQTARLVGNQRPVAPWIQSLDLLVLPSHWEGQPLVLLQALACRIPIIASEIEGNIAALGKEHPGLFPPGQIDVYTEKVRRALTYPAFASEILASQNRQPLPLAADVASQLASIYQAVK